MKTKEKLKHKDTQVVALKVPPRKGSTLYKKIKNRYIPEREIGCYDGLSEGAWLVVVKPGSTSIRKLLEPDYARVFACARLVEDAMVSAMREKDKLRPAMLPITLAHRAAWANLVCVAGEQFYSLERASISEIVEAGVNVLIDEAKRRGLK